MCKTLFCPPMIIFLYVNVNKKRKSFSKKSLAYSQRLPQHKTKFILHSTNKINYVDRLPFLLSRLSPKNIFLGEIYFEK